MNTLKVETQDLESRQLQMTVEVPGEQVERAMRTAARRLGSRTKIPGFRPGKAPFDVLVSRLGEEAVFEEALDTLGQEVYREALENASIEAFAPGMLNEVVSRTPLVLRYTVPLPPEIDLGAYRDLRIPFGPAAVTDEAVNEFLEELRQRQALIEPAERSVQLMDVVVADVEGEIPAAGDRSAEPLVRQQNASVLVSEDLDWPVPGVAQHIVGMKAADEKEFDFTFPEDYPAEGVRGRTGHFRLTCKEVKSRTVPEWSDDLARNLGDFADLLDLRLKVRQGLEDQARRRAESDHADNVVVKVVEGATVSFPPQLLEEELDDMLKDLDIRLKAQKLSLAEYLKVERKTEQELRKELEPRAHTRLQRALVLSEVVEAEKLEVTDEEIEAEIDRLASGANERAESMRKVLDHPAGRKRIAVDLLTQKAVARLVSIARGEAPAPAEMHDSVPSAETVDEQ